MTLADLTPRERQLCELLTEGLKNKEIAARMGVVESVAKHYLTHVYDKTGMSNRVELAMWYLQRKKDSAL